MKMWKTHCSIEVCMIQTLHHAIKQFQYLRNKFNNTDNSWRSEPRIFFLTLLILQHSTAEPQWLPVGYSQYEIHISIHFQPELKFTISKTLNMEPNKKAKLKNVQLIKCQGDKMSSWQNVKLTKCWVDKMSSWQNVELTKCRGDKMSSWQNVVLTKCWVDKMSSWQNVELTKCQVD